MMGGRTVSSLNPVALAISVVTLTGLPRGRGSICSAFCGTNVGAARCRHGAGEYVNLADRTIHTNTIEGYFSIFKRGMKGVYQHCGKKHLHRYAAEFEFRYNNRVANGVEDGERADNALRGIVGKRLTYGGPATA